MLDYRDIYVKQTGFAGAWRFPEERQRKVMRIARIVEKEQWSGLSNRNEGGRACGGDMQKKSGS